MLLKNQKSNKPQSTDFRRFHFLICENLRNLRTLPLHFPQRLRNIFKKSRKNLFHFEKGVTIYQSQVTYHRGYRHCGERLWK
ncbi:MAG: hypothetical protein B6244_00815 [Candidatus Cloacimonetes bacterium 4572_55]|nr:MAG: hypothetical protein B6244_00815 [Candidatus Cloacimonetes bacterium 4572_55]